MESLFELPDEWHGEYEARVTNHDTAAPWIEKYHYSKKLNPSSLYWGIFAPTLIAVVAIGEAANAYGVAQKYGLGAWRGNKEITRVVVHPDSPKNTATRCVALVCREVAKSGVQWLFSYADTGQGHHGGIYQGLNAVYVGLSPALPGWLLDGNPIHPRSVVAMFGTQAVGDAPRLAAERGHTLEKVAEMNTPKHLYILPVGDRASKRAIRKHLRRYVKPYPKRG